MLCCCFAPFLVLIANSILWYTYYYLMHQRRIQRNLPNPSFLQVVPTFLAMGWPRPPLFTSSTLLMEPLVTTPATFFYTLVYLTFITPTWFLLHACLWNYWCLGVFTLLLRWIWRPGLTGGLRHHHGWFCPYSFIIGTCNYRSN
jgi:hypothetical protein